MWKTSGAHFFKVESDVLGFRLLCFSLNFFSEASESQPHFHPGGSLSSTPSRFPAGVPREDDFVDVASYLFGPCSVVVGFMAAVTSRFAEAPGHGHF